MKANPKRIRRTRPKVKWCRVASFAELLTMFVAREAA